ncbi:hypothetical protein TNCV_2680241 [Trichonephila clavipes]|uniref:Uncharacterized protein n=1 Tax=Trichonephila clavipes TaxID=2585209 RepID=A0A8X6VHI2_TRICX|nr:hypothetical protein TNCV_2680241 [Trichonephila clavipes]
MALCLLTNPTSACNIKMIGFEFGDTVGGLKAVIWADVFQASLILLTLIVLYIKGIGEAGGISEIYRKSAESQRLNIFKFEEDFVERFVEWAQNEIAVAPDFHKRILFSDEAHFWLNGYVHTQNCRIWSEANPQVYVETLLHPEKLTVWCALWAGGILLQKR